MDTDAAPGIDLPDLCSWLAEESVLFADEQSPFRAVLTPGASRLVLVVGENASGKSLFFRALGAKVTQAGALPVTISIRERTGAGPGEMAGMRRAFMFGDEHEQSTGATSAKAVAAGFKNLDRPAGSILGLDEPELGLSDGYARALGEFIGTQAQEIPDVCAGVVVVTHSRSLVRGLLSGFGQTPTLVRLAGDTDPVAGGVEAWLAEDEHRTVEDLLALAATGLERFRRTHALLKH